MARKQDKKVSFEVRRGIYINGEKYMPGTAKKANIITIKENFAKELEASGKGVITDAKANTEVKEPSDDDDLIEAMGGDE
jgi:hypothetical protein